MKILKVILILFLLLVILAAAGLFIFLKTFDIDRYKPQIIAAAEKATGREVDFEDIDLSLSLKGVRVNLKQLTIKEDPEFREGDFLSVDNIYLGVDPLAYLVGKKVSVSSIQIRSPQVNIIREKDGSINVQTIGKKEQLSVPAVPAQAAVPSAVPAKAAALPLIFVDKIDLSGARINYIDRFFEPAMDITVSQAAFKADGFSLNSPFQFAAGGALLGSVKNFQLKGTAQVDQDNMSLELSNATASADFSTITLKALLRALPMLSAAPLTQDPKGKIEATIDKLQVGAKGLAALSLDAGLSEGYIAVKQLASPLSSIQAILQASEKDLFIKSFSSQLADGTISGSGSVSDYLAGQNFSANIDISGINLGKAIDQSGKPMTIQGLLSGKISLSGQGFNPDKTLATLAGDGEFGIKEGRLTDINVLKTVLDKISMLPDLAERIEASLPDRYKEKLTQKDTIITQADARVKIDSGIIYINDLIVEADGFLFQGNGQADFNQQLSLSGQLYIPEDLSASMISIVAELQYLLDEQKRILIPVAVKGKVPDIKFSVDLEYLGKRLFEKGGIEAIGGLLDKLFKKEEKSEKGAEDEQVQEEPAQEEQEEKQGLGGLLDKLFKGKSNE